MVETIEDNSSTCGRMLQGIERLTWKVLKEFLNVENMPVLMTAYHFHVTTLKRNILLLGSLRSHLLSYYNQPQVAFITTKYVIHGDDVRLYHYLVYTKVEVCQVIL